jgi:rhomboid protease GluP
MSRPERQEPDDEFRDLLRHLDDAGGQPQPEPTPVYGEAQPLPPQSYQLRLPFVRPRAIWAILAINVLIFIVPMLLDLFIAVGGLPVSEYILVLGAKDNEAIKQGGQYYRLLTAMFLHGGLLHILFNSFSLYMLGPETERIYGTARFLALYFIAGLAGSVASYAFSPALSVGASGAIFGLGGGLVAFYYISRKLFGEISRQQLGNLITILMINLFIGFSTPRIDNLAHVGGLIGGALAGLLLAPRFVVDERTYPPVIVRRSLALAWGGALALLALLVALALVINPPIR